MRAPLHPDEQKRIDTLRSYRVLDTLPEPEFDELAALAAEICEVPMAQINFIDFDRQWMKAEFGPHLGITPIDQSICAYCILQKEPLVISDTAVDSRFSGSSLGLRFYAGAQLLTPEGVPLGSLCVLDTAPKQLRESQVKSLQMVAGLVMLQLQQRKQLYLSDDERKLQERSLETAQVARFDWDIGSNRVFGNPLLNSFFNLSGDEVGLTLERYLAAIDQEDLAQISQNIHASIMNGESFEAHFRVKGSNDVTRRVIARGDTTFVDGKPVRLAGAVIDVTDKLVAEEALLESENRYRTLIESINEGYCIFDVEFDEGGAAVDYRFLEANPAFERLTGISLEHVVKHRSVKELFPDFEDRWIQTYGRVATTGEAITVVDESKALGRWYEVNAARVGGKDSRRVGAIFNDITLRILSDQEKERLLRELSIEQEKLSTLFSETPAFIALLTGKEMKFEFANEAYLQFVGSRNILGQPLLDALPELSDQGFLDILSQVFETGKSFAGQALPVSLSSDSEEHFLDLNLKPMRDPEGNVYGVLAHGIDVTEQVLARREVSQSEEVFRTIFEQAPDDAILVTDEDLKIVAWNPAASRLTGWSADEVIGSEANLIFTAEDRSSGIPELEASKAAIDQKVTDERWYVRKDGSRFWGSGTMNSLHVESGKVRGYLKVFRDATASYVEARTLAFLRELTDTIIELRDADNIIEISEKMLGEHLGASRVIFCEVTPDGERVVIRREWGPSVVSILGTNRFDMFGQDLVDDFKTGRTHVGVDANGEFIDDGALKAAKEIDALADISVPIVKDGRFTALFAVHQSRPRNWTDEEVGLVRQVADRVVSEIERSRAENILRQAQRRQKLLLDLAEGQREVSEPIEIMLSACRAVGEYLQVDRVGFFEMSDESTIDFKIGWSTGSTPEIKGLFPAQGLGSKLLNLLKEGWVKGVSDTRFDPLTSDSALGNISVISFISAPIIRNAEWQAGIYAANSTPRFWSDDEHSLLSEVADKTWDAVERARAQIAVQNSERRFRQLVELSPTTVWFGEPNGSVSYMSHDFYEATGLTASQVLPVGWFAVVHPDDRFATTEAWANARLVNGSFDTEFRMQFADAEYRWMSARALPVEDESGTTVGWLGSNHDIHERKTAEETLRRAVEDRTQELQKAVSEAEGFNYSISHDLRTPLRAIISTSKILLQDLGEKLEQEDRQMLERQSFNANRLGTLIDELLRLSRLARVQVRRRPLDISAMSKDVVDASESSCQVQIQPGMRAEGDPELVATVLTNLIENACKFSPNGGTIEIRENNGVFSVKDYGIGFEMTYAEKVFLPFERLVREGEFPGTGIGLANVKRIIERHDGRVWAESELGKGTTFYFTLTNI